MKKLDNKIKGLNIELDKNTKLYELNGVIDKFKKTTDNKYEVKISLSFDISHTTLHLKRIRKPFLTLATKDGKDVKKENKKPVKRKRLDIWRIIILPNYTEKKYSLWIENALISYSWNI